MSYQMRNNPGGPSCPATDRSLHTLIGVSILALVALGMLGTPPAMGSSFYEWDGGGTNNDITNPNNYNPNGAPPNNATANIDFRDSPRPFPTVSSFHWVEGLIFFANSSTYNLIGAEISVGLGGITNASTRTHLINNDITLSTTQYWVALAPLIQNGDVSGGNLFLAGDSDFTFNGAMSGNITMEGEGKFTLSGNSDLTTVIVKTGELEVDTNQIGALSGVTLEGGTVLSCSGLQLVDAAFRVRNGLATYEGTGSLTVPRLEGDTGSPYELCVRTDGGLTALDGPASGHLTIERGTFDSGGVTPCFSRTRVGDGLGSPSSAVLRAHTFLDAMVDSVEILADGCFEVLGSKQWIDVLRITEGRVSGSGRLTAGDIETFPGANTVLISTRWDPSVDSGQGRVHVGDGSAEIDLDMAGSIVGAQFEAVHKAGAGTLRLSGDSHGQLILFVDEGSVVLDAHLPASGLEGLHLAEGTEATLSQPGQTRSSANVVATGSAILNMETSHVISTLDAQGIVIQGSGTLEIGQSFGVTFRGHPPSLISAPLFLSAAQPGIECRAAFASCTAAVVATENLVIHGVGDLACADISSPTVLLNGPDLRVNHIDGNLSQLSGTLSPDASQSPTASLPTELVIDGDWDLGDEEVLIEIYGDPNSLEFDRVSVSGTATLTGSLTVEEGVSDLELIDGNRFCIIDANSIVGSFDQVNLPTLNDEDLTMELEIDLATASVYLNIVGGTSSTPEETSESSSHQPIALRSFPNPIQGWGKHFTLAYSLEKAGRVQVDVYAVSGRRVAAILDRHQPPGVYRSDFSREMSDLSSGAYLLRVRSPGKEERLPITILR